MSRFVLLTLLAVASVMPTIARADSRTVEWKLSGEQIDGSARSLIDDLGYESWFLMRTTTAKGSIQNRTWVRDGRYVPLEQTSTRMFGLPLAGAIFRVKPNSLAPFVAGVTENYTIDCTFRKGEVLLAPGPDHAVVLAWRSPFDGLLSMKGSFNNRQSCCGVNSQVNWYVERGTAPNLKSGFQPTTLAKGVSNLEVDNGISSFEFKELEVSVGDYFYFIVDAKADNTGTPHHGDGTALDLTITVSGATVPPPPTFEKDIRPLLATHCHDCHGQDTQEAELDLRTASTMVYGGESGSSLTPGDLSQSYLWTMVQSGEMPPEGSEPLSPKSKSLIRRWIKAGALSNEDLTKVKPREFITAKDREYWAFQLPKRHDLPEIHQSDLAESPVDYFLLKRLQKKRLTYSPTASKEIVVRRLYFDLIGLPPTPDQIDAFLNDTAPDAYERLVDRLLASPQYGERWGRHWMDTVGYVDVRLYDGDATTIYPNEGMWRYRDYIIKSFNADKPFDTFIQEQLAGDEMVDWRNIKAWTPETLEKVVATSYLRNIEDHTSEAQYGIDRRYEVLFDMMSMFSTSMLGLTFECSRCHNHKFDPITQRDYYRLLSYFETSYNVHNWVKPQDRWIPDVGPIARTEIDQHNASVDSQVKALQAKVAELEKADEQNKHQIESLKSQIAKLNSTRRSYGKIQALFNVDNPPTSHVLRRGDCFKPGIPVTHGTPEVLSVGVQPLAANRPESMPKGWTPTTGRRSQLAWWITSRQNPLTARVIMNRLWMHHFGEAIVSTPGNFGRNGSPPTHPELLDWLAVEFQECGWSLKHMHRMVLTSRAYQQSSRRTVDKNRAEEVDPDNELLWRQNLKRLESELIRDSVLSVSGRLDSHAFGPPVPVTKPVSGLSMVESGSSRNGQNRRSVYVFARRVYPLKFMELFDSPIMAINCTRRMNSTTVLQTFAQLNSDFVIQAARDTATRIDKVAFSSAKDREHRYSFAERKTKIVNSGFRTILGRTPNEDELKVCERFLSDQAAAHQEEGKSDQAESLAIANLCHMLICMNEFLYVE